MADFFGIGKAAEAASNAVVGTANAHAARDIAASQSNAAINIAKAGANAIGNLAAAGVNIAGSIVGGQIIGQAINGVTTLFNTTINGVLEKGRIKAQAEADKVRIEETAAAQIRVTDAAADARIREADAAARIERDRGQSQIDFAQAMAEIDRIRQDQALERFKKVSEAIAECQERLTSMSNSGIAALANMNQDLRERTIAFLENKKEKAQQMESDALMKAADDMEKMEKKLGHNERVMDVIVRTFDSRFAVIIEEKARFIASLEEDIQRFSKSVDTLTIKGQEFITDHLRHIQVQSPAETVRQVEGSSFKQLEDASGIKNI